MKEKSLLKKLTHLKNKKMPAYKKQDGTIVPNVMQELAWIEIGIESESIPANTESFLVNPRIADYIVLLESKIEGDLPKLSTK